MTREEFGKRLADNPKLREAFEIAKAERWKYSAEPVFGKTGRGFLRSEGVTEIEKSKKEQKRASSGVNERLCWTWNG